MTKAVPRSGEVVLLALSILFLFVCALSLGSARTVIRTDDAAWFRLVAEQSILSADFWFSSRAWAFPALLKICGSGNDTVSFVQFVLHAISHLFLAWALFIALKRGGLGIGLACAVLVYAISPYLLSWTVVVLAESLAISMQAAFLGALVLFWTWLEDGTWPERPGVPLALALIASAFVLTGTRDSWPYLLPLVAAGLVRTGFKGGRGSGASVSRRYAAVVVAAVLLATTVFQLTSARVGQRWRFGLINVVLVQVLPDPQVREHWVRAYDLPVDEELLRIAASYEIGKQNQAFAHRPFQLWLGERGMSAYARELLAHPLRTTRIVFDGHRETRDVFSWEYSDNQGDGTLPARLSQRGLFHPLWLPPGLDFIGALLPCILVLIIGPRSWRPPARALLVLALYLPFMSALGLLADTQEIYRHTLQVALSLRLLAVTGVVWIVALFLFRHRAKKVRDAP